MLKQRQTFSVKRVPSNQNIYPFSLPLPKRVALSATNTSSRQIHSGRHQASHLALCIPSPLFGPCDSVRNWLLNQGRTTHCFPISSGSCFLPTDPAAAAAQAQPPHLMLGQPPELVAASSLSPLSPAPVPVQTTAVVPKLQDQAASTDEAASHSATPPSAPHHPAAMPPKPKPADASDTIVVRGDSADESHDDSDDSIDYGEGEEGREREQLAPDAANDDYARTFDSPADRQDQSEADEAQPDVSMATESMNSPSAPDPLTSQSPAAAAPPSDPPSPPLPSGLPATNGSAEATSAPSEHANSESSSEPLPSDSAPDAAQPSTVPAAAGVKEITSTVSAPAAASAPAPANEDDASVDIQKLVDDITARGTATASPPKPPAPATPTTTQAVSATPAPSYPSSLPPKPAVPLPPGNLPAIPQPHHSFQTRGSNASAHSAVSMNIASPATPHHGTYMSAGAPGVGNEAVSSLPPPPPPTFGGPSHTHAHLQNAHHMPIARDASSGNYHGPSIKHQWDAFQADEKRYTSEAKWERFPEGSRIFIGKLTVDANLLPSTYKPLRKPIEREGNQT